jgi:HAD superfamily hydrolase (TIGR01509 family)
VFNNVLTSPGNKTGTQALDNIALVIFDCDGVLIDSEPIASSTLAQSMRAQGMAITDAEAHAKYTGNAVRIIHRMIEDEYGHPDMEGLFAHWNEMLYAGFAERLTPMEGMVELVRALDRPKCVASNSSTYRLERTLGTLPLWDAFFPQVYSADVVERPKPAPDLMLHCARAFAVAPEDCVMIDDSPHGIEAAVAAGMVGIGFVDPADLRPGRADVLFSAGALCVATGAKELPAALVDAGLALGQRQISSNRRASKV